MNQYFIYLIEVSISMTLFYLIYILLVKNETFHRLKRYVLLASVLLSLLIPQLPASKWTKELEKTIFPQESVITDISKYKDTFEKVVFGSIPDEVSRAEETSSTSCVFLRFRTPIPVLSGQLSCFNRTPCPADSGHVSCVNRTLYSSLFFA